MTAIITEKFRQHNATQFFESFSEASATVYYLMIGKSMPFTSGTSGGSDDSPPTPADDITSEFYTWDSAIASKKISSTNITFAIPRRDWSATSTFDMYEHNVSSSNTTTSGATNLFDSTFFFRTADNRVYKVLDNFGGSSAIGGSEPTSESTTPFTSGNYKIKYMYTITASEQQAFLTSDFMPVSTDSTVAAAAVDGALDTIKIVSGGSSFSTSSGSTITAIPIRGDGTGGVCSVTHTGGVITAATVTTAGSGYTYASVLASDIGNVSGADIDFIISPPGGHASDAVAELGGFFVMMNVDFATSESGEFNTSNDFRRIALLRNPTDSTTGSTATASTLDATKSMTFSGTPGSFQADEKITQASTGAVGFVVDFNSTTKVLRYIQPQFTNQGVDSNGNLTAFSSTNTVTGATSSATGTPSSHDITPELTADTGDILYIENRKPISRASDQTENVKLIVEFQEI